MERPRVVAEIGQGKGRTDYITRAMQSAHDAGCWAAKIQLLQPETIAQPDAPVYWDERRPEVTDQRSSFATAGCLDYGELAGLLARARAIGIELIATPFDLEAVDVMVRAGLCWCKIASGDITNRPLVEAVGAAFPSGVILSTGAADDHEIQEAIGWVGDPWAVLACTLAYPTAPADAELARVRTLEDLLGGRARGGRIGYSDHTHASSTAGYAVAAGATVLEKHFTLDRSDGSVPDNSFALDPRGMAEYVDTANVVADLLGSGRLGSTEAEAPARLGARRSICAARDLPAGHRIDARDLVMLRPATPEGFAPKEAHRVTGCTTSRAIAAGSPIVRSAVG
jgi:N,N'-diacetyllegionaminate synthase